MSTTVWPPISPENLLKEEEASLARELEWLLDYLQETFASLKAGLEECAVLLAPDQGPTTLAVSSHRSESLKGFVTRTGARIVKGVCPNDQRKSVVTVVTEAIQDVYLRLVSLPSPRGQQRHKLSVSTAAQAPTLVLEELTTVRNLISACLDIIDVSRWTGDAKNADFISGQLHLLFDNLEEAKQTLRGNPEVLAAWAERPIDDEMFDPPCPANVALNFDIADAALVVHVRVLEPAADNPTAESFSGFGIRDRLAFALGGAKPPTHDEMNEVFTYRGLDVRVKEKLRVESQDPSLLAAMAKLSALEHSVAMSRRALDTVMGKQD